MQIGAIAFFTALYGIGATAVYWIINRVSSNPRRVWLVVVIIGFVLTALPDLALAANPSSADLQPGLGTPNHLQFANALAFCLAHVAARQPVELRRRR